MYGRRLTGTRLAPYVFIFMEINNALLNIACLILYGKIWLRWHLDLKGNYYTLPLPYPNFSEALTYLSEQSPPHK